MATHLWLLWTDSAVGCCCWAGVGDWSDAALLWNRSNTALGELLWVCSRSAARARILLLQVVGVAIAASCGLWDVWNDLHAAWNNSGWATAAGSVGGSGWTSKTRGKLLKQSGGDVVCGDVHGVCDTKYDQRPLAREWEAGVGSVQLGAGLLLDLLDA